MWLSVVIHFQVICFFFCSHDLFSLFSIIIFKIYWFLLETNILIMLLLTKTPINISPIYIFFALVKHKHRKQDHETVIWYITIKHPEYWKTFKSLLHSTRIFKLTKQNKKTKNSILVCLFVTIRNPWACKSSKYKHHWSINGFWDFEMTNGFLFCEIVNKQTNKWIESHRKIISSFFWL